MATVGEPPRGGLRALARDETFLAAYRRRRSGEAYDRELITFFSGPECYAVEITELREIIKMRPITEVPRVPDFVIGVVTVRGNVLPAIDLRLRLGLESVEYGNSTRILVCDVRGEPHGLIVDRVGSVVRLRHEQIEGPPQMGGATATEFLAGIARRDDELMIVLDLTAVVSFSLGEGK